MSLQYNLRSTITPIELPPLYLDEIIDNNYESAYKYFISIKDKYLKNSEKNKWNTF